jgi:dienelactone hydrolase
VSDADSKDPEVPKPLWPEGVGPTQPPAAANPHAVPEGVPAPPAGSPGSHYSPPPKRTSAQIRADMERQRQELGESVDHLRERVTEITDWRSQIKKHRRAIVVGAVATGFVVGGLMALRRR